MLIVCGHAPASRSQATRGERNSSCLQDGVEREIVRIVWLVRCWPLSVGVPRLDEGIEPDMGVELLFLMFAGSRRRTRSPFAHGGGFSSASS